MVRASDGGTRTRTHARTHAPLPPTHTHTQVCLHSRQPSPRPTAAPQTATHPLPSAPPPVRRARPRGQQTSRGPYLSSAWPPFTSHTSSFPSRPSPPATRDCAGGPVNAGARAPHSASSPAKPPHTTPHTYGCTWRMASAKPSAEPRAQRHRNLAADIHSGGDGFRSLFVER